MKINVVVDENHDPSQVTITCREITPDIEKILREFNSQTLIATNRGSEFPLAVEDVLFFESENDTVFAHLIHASYQTKYRLYELEESLPIHFIRISKSSIVNTRHIASIQRGLTSVREITFHETHKIIYVSRKYYPILKERMEERTL